MKEKSIFYSQCEETAKGKGYTRIGVSGKEPEVATLQDPNLYALQGLPQCAVEGRKVRAEDRDLHSMGEDGVRLRERYSDLSGVSIDLNVLANRLYWIRHGRSSRIPVPIQY